jgi:hypothetical protein
MPRNPFAGLSVANIPVNPRLAIPPGMEGPIRYKVGWYAKPNHVDPNRIGDVGTIGGDTYVFSSVPLTEQQLLAEALALIHAEVGSILRRSPESVAGIDKTSDWDGSMQVLSFQVDTVQRAW